MHSSKQGLWRQPIETEGGCGHKSELPISINFPNPSTQTPLERWDIEQLYAPGLAPDRIYARHAAWLSGVDEFDAAMFGFSKSQAQATDPQVRCLML